MVTAASPLQTLAFKLTKRWSFQGYRPPRTVSMQRRTASESVASRLPSTGVTLPPSASMAACSWNFVTCLRDSIRLACGRRSEASSRRASSRSRSWSLFAPATGTLAVSARSCASQSWQSSALSARAGTGASERNDAAVIAETVRAAIGALLSADLAAPGAVAARGGRPLGAPATGRARGPSTGPILPSSPRAPSAGEPHFHRRKSGGPVVALPGREQAAVAVRPGVGGTAAERLLELVHDPVGELLRGSDELEAVPVTVDGDDAPLGLREAGARCDVLDAPADGGLVGRHVGAAEQHAAEALAAVGLPAGGAGGPRRAREERVRDPVIAPPRPPREDGAAALANRGLGTRLGLDGDRRLLLAPHAAAVQAANERFPLRAHWHLPATCVASRGSRGNSVTRVRAALGRQLDGRFRG